MFCITLKQHISKKVKKKLELGTPVKYVFLTPEPLLGSGVIQLCFSLPKRMLKL